MATMTCKMCHRTLDLHWQPTANGPRLFNTDGTMHSVNSTLSGSDGKYHVVGCTSSGVVQSQAIEIDVPKVQSVGSDLDEISNRLDKVTGMALGMTLEVANIATKVDKSTHDLTHELNMFKFDMQTDFSKLDQKWTDIAESRREVIIHVGDRPAYKPNGRQHENLEILLRLLSANQSVYLRGPAGSGKTTGVSVAAQAMSLPMYLFSVGPQTSKSDIFGYMAGGGHYVDSIVRRWCEEGGILCLDEVDSGNAGLNTALNIIAEPNNRLISFPDRVVEKHKDCLVVATANTFGNGADAVYIGRNQQDGAFLDRFTVLSWDYDWGFVSELSGNYEWTEYVRKLYESASRQKCRVVIGPRAAIQGSQLISAGFTWEQAAEMRIWARVSTEDRRKIESNI